MTERPTPDLTIVETRVYRGANVWSYDKAIHLVVDLGSLEEFPTNTLPGFTEHLLEMLPGLREHSCSRGRRGGFVERLNEGTWLGPRRRARRAGPAAGRRPRHPARQDPPGQGPARASTTSSSGTPTSRSASPPPGSPYAWSTTSSRPTPSSTGTPSSSRFILRAERTAFGPSTQAILDEAVSRDIPWLRLNQYSLVQLGQGVHAKRIRATMTSATVVDRRRHRLRQGPHHPAPRRCRAAGAQAGDGAHRGAGGPRGRTGSATRSWSSRSTATTAAASA